MTTFMQLKTSITLLKDCRVTYETCVILEHHFLLHGEYYKYFIMNENILMKNIRNFKRKSKSSF